MECKFHPGENTVDKCVLCYTPICPECITKSQEFSYDRLCTKCLKAVGISVNPMLDDLDFE